MDSEIDVERSRLYSVNRTFLVGLSLVAVQTILFTALFILSFGTRNIGVAGLGPVLPTLTIWSLFGTAMLIGCSLADASDTVKTLFVSSIFGLVLTALITVTILSLR